MRKKPANEGIQLQQSLMKDQTRYNDLSSNSNQNPNFQSSSNPIKNSENAPLFNSEQTLKSDDTFGLRQRSFSDGGSDPDDTKICTPLQSTKRILKNQFSKRSCLDWLHIFFPCTKWLKSYSWREFFFADLIAGMTVGIMMIPQSMSYAGIAGLPPQYGLYSAFFPVLAYVVFGNSRQLSVGPISITSMLLQEGVTKMVPGRAEIHHLDELNPSEELIMEKYIQKAIQMALLVGLIHVFLGVLRLGFLTNCLSHSVISGFTTGAVLIIGFSQVVLFSLFENIYKFQWQEFFMGVFWIFVLQAFKYVGKWYPRLKFLKPAGPLVVSVLGIFLVSVFQLNKRGVKIVGDIPQGLPPSSIQNWSTIEDLPEMFRISAAITVVGLMESISIAKALALKNKYELNANQELVGLGVANIFGSAFSAYPTTGAFSRSAVANETGAKTGIAGLVTALLVGFILLFLTQVFERMPMNTLAAIVISGISGLFDLKTMFYLFQFSVMDWLQWMIAFLGTIFLGAEMGLGIAIGFTLILVIYQAVNPKMEVLGILPETNVFENLQQYQQAQPVQNLFIVRLIGPIYVGNVQTIKQKLLKYRNVVQNISNELGHKIRTIVLDIPNVERIDASGIQMFQQIIQMYNESKFQLILITKSSGAIQCLNHASKEGVLDSSFVKKFVFSDISDCVRQHQFVDEEDNFVMVHSGELELQER